MHELSVALEICRIAEAQVGRDGLAAVTEVGLEVGRDAGVEPDNLLFCLRALLDRPPFSGPTTVLELTNGDDLRVRYLDVDDDRTTN